MKRFNRYITLLLIATALISCNKFDDINTDPDATTKVTSSLLANGLLLDIMQTGGSKNFVYDNFLSKQLAWGEGMESYQYNIFDRSSFSGFKMLTNCEKMLEAASEDDQNAYGGLAHFLKAYKLFYMSLEMGDIPYEEALQGETGLVKPKYNTQKEVMQFVLADLDKAYELFSQANDFTGDEMLGGNVEKWKKVTTALQLKVLMSLSLKESDPDLKIKERFASIFSSRLLMDSNDDNLQLTYADKANTVYPFHNTQTKHAGYSMISTTIINAFQETEDPRLFYYAKPAQSKIDEGLTADDRNAYLGVDPSLPFDQIKKMFSSGSFCGLNPRYTDLPSGEPLMRISYLEQNFILAEAATRGWISADASDYYKKGIKASMDFITTYTPDEEIYHHGHPLTEDVKNAFLENPQIQLGSNKEENIEKILTQRYLASFMQHPYDSYYDYRRTGYPKLPINPETNQNPVHDKIPVRWMYPKSEYDYNKENVEEAVQRQFGGVDDVNKEMWILQ